MSDIEKKAPIGIAILDMPGTFGYFTDRFYYNLDYVCEAFQATCNSLGLEKMIILGVTPDYIVTKSDDKKSINYDMAVHTCEGWSMGKLIGMQKNLYGTIIKTYTDGKEKSVCPDVEFIGTICSNGFTTPNICKIATKDGKPIAYSPETCIDFLQNPDAYKLPGVDYEKTFIKLSKSNLNDKRQKENYVDYFAITNDAPRPYSIDGYRPEIEHYSDLAASNLSEYLAELAKQFDIKQVIASSYEWAPQSNGKGIIDKDEVAKVCGCPVFYIRTARISTQLTDEAYNYSGGCDSGALYTDGLKRGVEVFIRSLGIPYKYREDKRSVFPKAKKKRFPGLDYNPLNSPIMAKKSDQ